MKQLATIGTVVLVLLAAAIYYHQNPPIGGVVPPDVVVPTAPEVPTTNINKPVVKATVDGTLSMATSISNGYLLQGGMHDVYAAVDVSAIEHIGAERPPLNIAMVIDRSGSMSGDKIEHAKAAARRMVNILGPQDRVAIISYGSDVSVDFYSQPVNDSTRMSLLRAINNINVGGGTNLSGGFQRGYAEVAKWQGGEAISRVVLMSDGLANVGITNTPQLVDLASRALAAKVTVSTIGMGLDYNEDLMTQMANEGAGKYYFVDRSETVVSILDQEVSSLASTVARNTALVIKLGPGVTLQELYGFASQTSGDQVFVSLAEFASAEAKNILMRLRVDATAAGSLPLIQTALSYDDLVQEKPIHAVVACSSEVTSDASKLQTLVNVDVIARVQQVEVAKSMADAMVLFQDGKADEASNTLEAAQIKMRERRSKYEFKRAERYDAVDREIDTLRKQVTAGPAPASEGGRRMIKENKARSNNIIHSIDLF